MAAKANYFKLGLFVIGAVAAGVAVLLIIGTGRWLKPRTTMETYFNESVQGLDIGGMAEAALNNRLTPIELPAARGRILDANGTVLANSVIRYNVVVDQRVNTKTESFKRLDTVGDKEELVTVSRDKGIEELAAVLGQDPGTSKRP